LQRSRQPRSRARKPVEEVAVDLAQRQRPERWSQVVADDPLVPGAGRRLDVEGLEVAVEHLVGRRRGLRVPTLVDLVEQPRPYLLRFRRRTRLRRGHLVEVVHWHDAGSKPAYTFTSSDPLSDVSIDLAAVRR
jgi:hypothetical protein